MTARIPPPPHQIQRRAWEAAWRDQMRRHVRALRRRGLTLRQTAKCCGIGKDTVRKFDVPGPLFRTVTRVLPDGTARVVRQ